MSSARQAFDVARQHFQAGRAQEAEQLCLQVLEGDPDQIDALHLLALIAGRTRQDSRAIDYLKAVLRLDPQLAAAHNNLGIVLFRQRKVPEAVASFQEAAQPRAGLRGRA